MESGHSKLISLQLWEFGSAVPFYRGVRFYIVGGVGSVIAIITEMDWLIIENKTVANISPC